MRAPGRGKAAGEAGAGRGILPLAAAALLFLLLPACGERLGTVRDYRRAGIAAMQAGEYETAAESFRRAMDYYGTARQDGTKIDILRYLGEALLRSENWEEAEKYYRQLLEEDGRRAEYLDLLALCLIRSGGADEAAELYGEAGELIGEGPLPVFHLEALYSLGEALTQSGDPERRALALRLYQEAAAAGEEDAELQGRIGKLLTASGEPDSAEEYFLRALELVEERLAEEGLGEEERAALRETRRELLFNEAVRSEYAGSFEEALREMKDIAAEYGETPELLHEIAFLESRVGRGGEKE